MPIPTLKGKRENAKHLVQWMLLDFGFIVIWKQAIQKERFANGNLKIPLYGGRYTSKGRGRLCHTRLLSTLKTFLAFRYLHAMINSILAFSDKKKFLPFDFKAFRSTPPSLNILILQSWFYGLL